MKKEYIQNLGERKKFNKTRRVISKMNGDNLEGKRVQVRSKDNKKRNKPGY